MDFPFFLNFWRTIFNSKNQILAIETSKIHNSQKWNNLRTKSPLSKFMTILLFLVKSSLRIDYYFTYLCGHRLILTQITSKT